VPREPIDEVTEALRAGRPPGLAWTLHWGMGGRDPVTAAWEATHVIEALLELLRALGPERARPALEAYDTRCAAMKRLEPGLSPLETIRTAAQAPTLDEVLAVVERRRAS
jgi:hypothetical protein